MYSIRALVAVMALVVVATSAHALVAQQNTIRASSSFRLIETAPGARAWLSPAEVDSLLAREQHFMDVTDYQKLDEEQLAFTAAPLQAPRFPNAVTPLLVQLNASRIRQDLITFSAFHNRYYDSEFGLLSAEWLYATVAALAQNSVHNVSVQKFEHKWRQFSIIARFERAAFVDEGIVVVGAHQDSINQRDRPGADDDGSGAMTTLEAFRVLCESSQFAPRHAVEFHWYSGEELGLLGSQAVALHYKRQKKQIIAMLQNDMTGYAPKDKMAHFGVVTDFTDGETTSFLKQLIEKYARITWVDTRCGYACSDHASWIKAGYRAAFPFEGRFTEHSPFIHSPQDTVETVNFEHMVEFAKLSVSFAVELSYQ